jgi:hypothetical protein
VSDEITRILRDVRDTLLEEPVSPRVAAPHEINEHYCRYVAETVVERASDERDVRVLQDGGSGYAHAWVAADGKHYDAECVEGVDDYRNLPFFRRHPEAAKHVEADSVSRERLRKRGLNPLYPDG